VVARCGARAGPMPAVGLLLLCCVMAGCTPDHSVGRSGTPAQVVSPVPTSAPPAPVPDTPEPTSAPPVSQAEVDRLRALGYLEYDQDVPEPSGKGVVFLDRDRAQPGYTLVVYASSCRCDLITLEGGLVNTWSTSPCRRWEFALLLEDGDLLVVGSDADEATGADARIAERYLARLAWSGEEVWRRRLPVHHYLELTPQGQLMTLLFERRRIAAVDPDIDAVDCSLALLSMDGEVVERMSLYDVVAASRRRFPLHVSRQGIRGDCCIDLFHSNAVKRVQCSDSTGTNPICAAGNVVVTSRHQDAVLVVNWPRRELVWFWGPGELSGPHDGSILADGTLLVFDNGLDRSSSRIVELDVANGQLARYAPRDPDFFTRVMGACQKLPNGNLLITLTDGCYGIELGMDGARAWAYSGVARSPSGRRAKIARMTRIPQATVEAILARQRTSSGVEGP